MEKPLYSIGHGTRKAEVFLGLLQRYGIKYLADVRSRPYSRFNPHFNKNRLDNLLKEHGITYVFMGDTLGGRPDDASCYTNGKPDYAIMAKKPFFLEGIGRLKEAYDKGLSLAMMCSESKPGECHRSMLIAKALEALKIPVMHIDEKGELKEQDEVIKSVPKPSGPDLFSGG